MGISARGAPFKNQRATTGMKNLFSYLKNVRGELTHVVWPKSRQALMHTLLILAISAFVAVCIGVLDYLLTSLVGIII
ncbi:preprotein translocase subunit SecE [Candidatus Parcubacteria bacterium]|nr:preprotein translocase subunit SecE [Candidatus Parcubacteria bacterium]